MESSVAAKLEGFFARYPEKTYPKGQILVFAGEAPDHIFHLISGRVRKYDVSARGDEVIVNLFKPPAFFPMSWAISQLQNDFFYKTETDVKLHVVPGGEALHFLQSNPDVMLDLLDRIYIGSEGMLGKMVRLMAGNAESRLLYELLIETRRFGKDDGPNRKVIAVTESDLAARTGLTRETVSREMQKLKDKGLVSLNAKKLLIRDVSQLETLATQPV